MEEVIWVELLSRHRGVIQRHRCTGRAIRIGRAYSNDVVLDDPYVAPEHLLILRDADGSLVAEDLGSANGVFLERGGARIARRVLDGDETLRIGHSWVRIRDARHAVVPERPETKPSRPWLTTVAVASVALLLELVQIWLGETDQPRPSHYIVPLASLAVAVTLWTSLWSITSRVLTGQARFERNFLIASAGLLAMSLWDLAAEWGAFSLSAAGLGEIRFAALWAFLAGICFFHLRAISPGRAELKAAVLAGLAVAAVAVQTLMQSEARARFGEQRYVQTLLPPALRLARLRDEDGFFTDVRTLMQDLDQRRQDEP